MTKTAIYARVSPKPDEGVDSIETQVERCLEYCNSLSEHCPMIFKDQSVSAAKVPMAEREGGGRLLLAVDSQYIDTIVVQRLDRIFRDEVDGLQWLRSFEKNGVKLHLADQGGCSIDCSTATGSLLAGTLLLHAAFEPRLISERTSGAMKRYQSEGRVMNGNPPYGMMIDLADPTKIVENPVEQVVIDLVTRMSKDGRGVGEITTYLNSRRDYYTPRGLQFYPKTIAAIINDA